MNTGHDGSLTTVHANTPRDALMRLETMVAMANFDIPTEFIRKFISSAIHIVIQVARLTDGRRKLVSLQEITGMEGNTVTMQEIFTFEKTRVDENGNVRGKFKFTGIRPKFIERFKVAGIKFNQDLFNRSFQVDV
ncbi:MAG TPA: ATPase, T2SS/T4P/T4SS family, partial [Desulfotignum sp.]|nr:ATPase, T2SS/T4P/T4SS family [Desulfotignum sp.]